VPHSLVPELETGVNQEKVTARSPTRFPAASAQEQFHTWISTRLRIEKQREKLWEPLFVSAALLSWGWYVFWFLRALHDYTIVPWP